MVGTNQKCNGYYNIRITQNEYVGGSRSHYPYEAFKMALNGFQYLKSFCCISIDHYYHSLSLVDTTIMVSNKYLNIGEQVMVIFFSFFLFYLESYHSNDITCKKTLISALGEYNSNELGEPHFLLLNCM